MVFAGCGRRGGNLPDVKRFFGGLLVVALLAGCVPSGTTLASKGSAVPVLQGAVTVAPPRGYCVDGKASHELADTAVMILGRCSAGSSAQPALITITVGPPESARALKPGARALAEYFKSPAGRAALALDGRPGSVRLKSVAVVDGVLVLNLDDRDLGAYLRAMMPMRGRLVSVAVAPPQGEALDEAAGTGLLDKAVQAMRAANAG